MRTRKHWWLALVLVLALVAASCGDDDAQVESSDAPSTDDSPAPAEDSDAPSTDDSPPPAEDSDAPSTDDSPAADGTSEDGADDGATDGGVADGGGTEEAVGSEQPTSLNIAAVFVIPADDPWNSGLLDAIDRLAEERPYGLNITYEYFENIDFPDGERVIRDLASSGDYGMIIAHSSYGEAVSAVSGDYPDIAFSFAGYAPDVAGGNNYWTGISLHEPAYLAGIAAALLVEDGQGVGAVGGFPFPDVAAPVNGFFDGARSVNPAIATNVTYIESWFDPARAAEAAAALISEGAGALYAAAAFGTFSAIAEGDSIYAIGDLADVSALAPHAVITSTVALWDPNLRVMIDGWWEHNANGVPMDAPTEQLIFSMAEGGGDIAPLNESLVPEDVRAEVLAVRDQIMSGELVVELKIEAE